jgi:hypothetical protein
MQSAKVVRANDNQEDTIIKESTNEHSTENTSASGQFGQRSSKIIFDNKELYRHQIVEQYLN